MPGLHAQLTRNELTSALDATNVQYADLTAKLEHARLAAGA